MKKTTRPNLLQRLRLKKFLSKTPRLGVCWYLEDEWNKVKSEAVDPERFDETFSDWENMASGALKDLQKTGLEPVKVIVLAEELRQWCVIHGRENSAESRSAFVADLLGGKGAMIA